MSTWSSISQATFCKVPPRTFRRSTTKFSQSSISSMTHCRITTSLKAFLKSQQTYTTGTMLSLAPILSASLINSSIALAVSLTKTSSSLPSINLNPTLQHIETDDYDDDTTPTMMTTTLMMMTITLYEIGIFPFLHLTSKG